jgi:hypothetical protein
MPEVRAHSNHCHIERPHDLRRARLACRRTEAADLKVRRGGETSKTGRLVEYLKSYVMPPPEITPAKPRSKALDRALSLIAAVLVVAIVIVARS